LAVDANQQRSGGGAAPVGKILQAPGIEPAPLRGESKALRPTNACAQQLLDSPLEPLLAVFEREIKDVALQRLDHAQSASRMHGSYPAELRTPRASCEARSWCDVGRRGVARVREANPGSSSSPDFDALIQATAASLSRPPNICACSRALQCEYQRRLGRPSSP
jgi:hypothetical protein